MAFPQSFKVLCLFFALGISIAAGQGVPPPSQTVDKVYYCSHDSGCHEYCEDILEPVCAQHQVTCGSASCTPIEITYPNACTACRDENVISYIYGPCEGYCDEGCEEDEEEECEGEQCEEDDEEEKTCTVIPKHCPQDYDPVCGHYLDCPDGDCSETFNNACLACKNHVDYYYLDGECPVG